MIDSIKEFLGEDWKRTEEMLSGSLSSDVALLSDINGTMLSHKGKQLRPMLTLLCARCCGAAGEDSIRFAAAAEMLHNATLMHDDVADDSMQRRGIPTLLSVLGASPAVLVGDFWLARTMNVIMGARCRDEVAPLFAKTMTDLAEGEMLQLEKAALADTEMEDYLRIIHCKTASLFVAACLSGAISTGAPEEYRNAVREYAEALGLAFQIKDDILDYVGSEELGKPRGVDIKEKKITLPLLGAMKGSPREKQIRQMVKTIDAHPENVGEITLFVRENDGVARAAEELDGYIDKALEALGRLPECPEREMLASLARFNALREV